MEDLSIIREKINNIDNQLVDLWKNRMELCLSVAEYKKENNLPVLDANRERELLDRVAGLAGDNLDVYSRVLYETIMSISRSYQHKHLYGDNKLTEKIKASIFEKGRVLKSLFAFKRA